MLNKKKKNNEHPMIKIDDEQLEYLAQVFLSLPIKEKVKYTTFEYFLLTHAK